MDKLTQKQVVETASIPLVAKQPPAKISRDINSLAIAHKLFKQIFKRKKITYKDTLNNKVVIERKRLLNHLQGGKGGITRARYLPLLEDIIKNPQLIINESTEKHPNRYHYFVKYQFASGKKNISVRADMENGKIIVFGLSPVSNGKIETRLKADKLLYQGK